MNIGEAIEILRKGGRVRRLGWSYMYAFLVLVEPSGDVAHLGPKASAWAWGCDNTPWIALKQKRRFDPWSASQEDLLATDWVED